TPRTLKSSATGHLLQGFNVELRQPSSAEPRLAGRGSPDPAPAATARSPALGRPVNRRSSAHLGFRRMISLGVLALFRRSRLGFRSATLSNGVRKRSS